MRTRFLLVTPLCGAALLASACGMGVNDPAGPTSGGTTMQPSGSSTPPPSTPAGTQPKNPTTGSNNPPASQPGQPSQPGPTTPQPNGSTFSGGSVSGTWSGPISVTGKVVVDKGSTLTINAGSAVTFAANAGITVNGTLQIQGSAASRVSLAGASWVGLEIAGTLTGQSFDISKGTLCLSGLAGSSITVSDATLVGCNQSLRLANGGKFTGTKVTGGVTVQITGGLLDMSNSIINLGSPTGTGSDCTDWAGGSAKLDHVRFMACHCPLHFNSTDSPISVTNSIFDEGSVPVMIASSKATFTNNSFLSVNNGPQFDDIGGSIQADISNNYYGGGAPTVSTTNAGQFTGANMYLRQAPQGVGPTITP